MSHGGDATEAEPDLTPLLDLVLQLLMFFIINVNFVTEEVTQEVNLPTSASARPIDTPDPSAIILSQKSMKSREFVNNLSPEEQDRLRNQESVVLTLGRRPMTQLECKAWLKDKYADAQKDPSLVDKNGNVKTVINFRPDGDLENAQLFQLMNHCKAVGYKHLKVRAKIDSGVQQ
jgi:biopolymer transport protein ExbD